MLQGQKWIDFFNNNENKEDLISLAVDFYKTEEGKRFLKTPLVITAKNQNGKITESI